MKIRADYRTKPFISVDEAADLTGRSKSWIYQLVHYGRIQGGGVGAYWLEQSSVVRAFSKRRATA